VGSETCEATVFDYDGWTLGSAQSLLVVCESQENPPYEGTEISSKSGKIGEILRGGLPNISPPPHFDDVITGVSM